MKKADNIDVLLVNSPLFRKFPEKYDEDSLPPLGLGYIAKNLKDKGYRVKLLDAIASKLSLSKLKIEINTIKPKTLGINIFSTNYELVKELIESIDFSIKIVIGGLATKELYKHIFNWKTDNLVSVVAGDGEKIIIDIIGDSIVEKATEEHINFKYYRVAKNSQYYVKDINNLEVDRSVFVNEPVPHPFGFYEANIVTSRGCIFNCSFCAAAYSQNKDFGIRERSEESVIDELNKIQQMFPEVSSVRVLDDLFLKKPKHIEYAIKIFNNFNFQWRSMAHVSTFRNVTDETMERLRQSGCKELFIGIESGSPKILKSIHKTSNVDLIFENLSIVLKSGIGIKAYFIYGFPEETQEDAEMTKHLARRLFDLANDYRTSFRTSVFQYRPYHGTEIYHGLKNKYDSIDNINNIVPNIELSERVKRIQFNFHSGNYSKIADNKLHSYICDTTELNNTDIFERLRNANKPDKLQAM